MMFLKDINITFMEPCIAEADKIRLKADFSDDISEVMPYLNAVLTNAAYSREGSLITFMKESRLLVLYPTNMTMAKARNMTDALQMFDWLKELINETWEKHDEITPNFEKKKRPAVMDIYKLLPQTNCRECGDATCFAFAAKLLQGAQDIENCKLLSLKEYTDQLTMIRAMIGA